MIELIYSRMENLEDIYIEAGITDNKEEKQRVRRKIKAVYVHKDFNVGNRQNDISIIEVCNYCIIISLMNQ